MIDVKAAAVGKWASILTLLGIDSKHLIGKHGPCVLCGGKDRARWNRATEHYHCNACGSMSGMDLAIAYTGTPFKDLAQEIKKSILGIATVTANNDQDDYQKNLVYIESLKPKLRKLNGNDPASLYLKNRGLTVAPEKHVWWMDEYKGMPAMVAMFSTASGELSTLHITHLTADGEKANVEVQKRILPVARPMTGGAIQLFNADKVLGLAEGIESALAVHELEGIPVWATGNAQMMEKFEIPEYVEELWIYADSDANFTGQKSAYTLANKAALKGIKTRVSFVMNGDRWAADHGGKTDFLDYLILQKHGQKKQSA